MAAFTALAIGSLVLGGVRAVQGWRAGGRAAEAGEAQRRAAESQAELSEFNAEVAELQAADAIARGEEEESRYRTAVRGIIGAQRAGIAASNVDVGYGSALDVQADTAAQAELDVHQIRNNAKREAWGHEVDAEDNRRRARIQREEGVMLEAAGREQRTQARIGAVTSLVGTGVNLFANSYGFGRGGGSTRVPGLGPSTINVGGGFAGNFGRGGR